MQKQEFIQRTGIYPTNQLYAVIEQYYMDCDMDKDTFCAQYKENRDGLAEKIARLLEKSLYDQMEHLQDECIRLKLENTNLLAKLERELEWSEPYLSSNIKEEDYEVLRACSFTYDWKDVDVKESLSSWYGFREEAIVIVKKIPYWRKNHHHRVQKQAEYFSCPPLYAASDWNYVRFRVCDVVYEHVNGSLKHIGYEDDALLDD